MTVAADILIVEPGPLTARRTAPAKTLTPGLWPALALTLTLVEPEAALSHSRPTAVVEAPTLRAEAVAARLRRLLS